MGLVDLILNVAALLLFINWREARQIRRQKPDQTSLVALLKYVGKPNHRQWWILSLIPLLIFLRAILFQEVGRKLHWLPRLDLDIVELPFRSEKNGRMLPYSILDFLLLLGRFYILLLLAASINRHVSDDDAVMRWVRIQLGSLSRLPLWAGILLVVAVAIAGWFAVTPLLRHLEIMPPGLVPGRTAVEGLLLGLAALLTWKYLITGVMILFVANTYVYFGRSSFWHFIQVTGQNILKPLHGLPLILGKFDLRPLLMIAAVTLLALGARLALERLYVYLPRWI